MKIALPNDSLQDIGGGFTFRRNLIKGLGDRVEIANSYDEADLIFITSSSMISRETIMKIIDSKKPVVFRVDNVPRNSRNRNTGTSRMLKCAKIAKAVIYQCEWAREYLSSFLGNRGLVIYNGIDTDIFKPSGDKFNWDQPVYLYSRYNRDETKRWEEAWYNYQMIHKENPFSQLKIVGQFSPEQVDYNFDFFQGEKVEYMGVVRNEKEMAKIYRSCSFFLATYYNDCYSNTYLEAMSCGMKLYQPSMTGGTPELIKNFEKGLEFNSLKRMADDYLKLFQSL